MAIQTFTSGQVLTAAQVNALQSNDFNQTVTTKTADYTPTTTTDIGTRLIMNSASATTITINTSIYSAGDTLFLSNIGAGVCTLTAGTCTITSAGPLAIPQYGGGLLYFTSASAAIYYPTAVTIPAASSALTFISGGSVGTGTSFSLPNDSFTATYQNYLILWSQVGKSGGVDLNMRLRASGTDTTSNDYNFAGYSTNNSGTYSAIGGGSSAAFWSWGECNNTALGTTSGFTYIYGPQVADLTAYGTQSYTSGGLAKCFAGRINLSTQFDSLTIFSATASFNTGNYKLYGLADS